MMEVVGEAVIAALTLFISRSLSMQLIGKDDDLNSNLRHCNIRFSHSFALPFNCLNLPLIDIFTCTF